MVILVVQTEMRTVFFKIQGFDRYVSLKFLDILLHTN